MMRRDGVDYVRCLACDSVFEADDLESGPSLDDNEDDEESSGKDLRSKKAS